MDFLQPFTVNAIFRVVAEDDDASVADEFSYLHRLIDFLRRGGGSAWSSGVVGNGRTAAYCSGNGCYLHLFVGVGERNLR